MHTSGHTSLYKALHSVQGSSLFDFLVMCHESLRCIFKIVVMDAQLPTNDTVETVTFPKNRSMFAGVNISGLQIVISKQAILNRFHIEG